MDVPFKQHKGYDPLGDCGKGKCPICARNNAIFKVKTKLKQIIDRIIFFIVCKVLSLLGNRIFSILYF